MFKCENCVDTASHEYKLTDKASLYFCEKHIPSFLKRAKLAGLLPMTEEHKANLEQGLKEITVPSIVVDEPTAEAVVEEPTNTEAPAPKKATTKKKAK